MAITQHETQKMPGWAQHLLTCIRDYEINVVKEFNKKNHTGSLDHAEK